MNPQKVAVIKVENDVEISVLEAVNLLSGIEHFTKPGQKFLLKPNLFTMKIPEEGVTTDKRMCVRKTVNVFNISAV